jgi:DNA mismatch repair protein MutS2
MRPPLHIFPSDLTASLDFPEIIEELQSRCSTVEAAKEIGQLVPSGAFDEVLSALRKADECLQLYLREFPLPALSFELGADTLSLLKTRNACLDADQFFELISLCLAQDGAYRHLKEHRLEAPELFALIEEDPPLPQIPKAIDAVFDPHRTVRSSASKELANIRSSLGKKRTAADRIFYRVRQKLASKGLLGDIDESVHDNRRVLAVQAGYKSQVNGIFHGSSNKHSLYYMEPSECIAINNEIAQLIDQERKEVQRILRHLTAEIALYQPQLERYRDLLIRLDVVRAKAQFGKRFDCIVPRVNREGKTRLIEARNPVLLLHNQRKSKPTVPCSLELDPSSRLLVISGPNAGGKSIALKTVGLVQCMLQCGIPVPLDPGSEVAFVKGLLGDIGDSQSIENELSTYSSRLEKMKVFLERADANALLLIDEFGSGTDPDLGSALAEEVLERLHGLQVRGVITTHYNRIKSLASQLDGAFNGNMAFDQKHFRPEYRLETGTPGSSYTFEVARRAGLPEELIRKAKRRLSKDKVRLDGLLSGVQREKQQLTEKRKRLTEELALLRELKSEQEDKIRKLEAKLKKQGNVNEEQSRQLMWGKRFARFVQEWEKAKSKKARKELTDRIVSFLTEQTAQAKKMTEQEAQREKRREDARMKRLLAVPISPGDEVRMMGTRQKGKVLSVKGSRFQVQFGNMISSLERDKIIKTDLEKERTQKKEAPPAPKKKQK